MKQKNKYLFKLLAAFFSILVFWWLESGLLIRNGDELLKSSIFALCFFIAINKVFRKYLLWAGLILLGLMVILYMFWQVPVAAVLGSFGIGMIAIFLIGLLSELIKRGNIEEV